MRVKTGFLCVMMSMTLCNASFASEALRIMTLNGAQLPNLIGMGNGDKRAKKLAQEVQLLAPLPDVICMQEIFTESAREILEERLRDLYPFVSHDNNYPLFGVNSGLMLLSRYPILRSFQHEYSEYRGIENFAAKGVLGAQIKFKDQTLLVFTTHLQTGGKWAILDPIDSGKPNTDEIKIGQVEEARNFIYHVRQSSPQSHTFFMGDFNIKSHDDLYPLTRRVLTGWRDTHAASCSKDNGTTWADDGEKSKGNRIDYIWVLGDAISGQSCINDRFSLKITDHLAVIGDFILP